MRALARLVPAVLLASMLAPASGAAGASADATATHQADPQRLLAQARAFAATGRTADAVATFDRAASAFGARGDRTGQAAALAAKGEAQEVGGRFNDALRSARAALDLDLRSGERRRAVSDLVDAGIAEEDLNRYDAALRDDRRALGQARALQDRADEANALGSIGVVEMRRGQYADALRDHRQSLAIDRALGNSLGAGDELGRIGIAEEQLGAYDDALRDLDAALALHRRIVNVRGEAKTFNNIGIVDEHLGRFAAALAAHERALPFFRAIGNRLGEADDLDNIGIVDDDLGRYLPALAAHEQALALFRALGNRLGEAENLANTAIVDNDLGRYDESLRALDRALLLDRQIGNAPGEANALGSVGVVYENLGRFEDALAEFQEALAIHRKIGDRRGQASDLGDIGLALEEAGRPTDALAALEDAYGLDRALDNAAGEAADLNDVANLQERAGRYADALERHERALTLDRTTGDRLQQSEDLTNIGSEQNALGRSTDALASARAALRIERGLGAPESVWRALRVAARAEAALGRRDDALADYDAAIAHIEGVRAALGAVAERRSYFENKLFVYDEYVDYLRELDGRFPGRGYDRQALDIFEREQGRAFLEEVGQSSARRFSGVPPEVTARESELARAAERVDAQLARARTGASVDLPAVASLARESERLHAARTAFDERLRAAYPAYFALTHPRPADPGALQTLLAPGETMLVYAVLDDATALWVIDRTRLQLLTLPGGTNDVAAAVAAVLRGPQAVEDDLAHYVTSTRRLREHAAALAPQVAADSFALYRRLVPEPARAAVENSTQLLVVPTGPLYRLPFETLVTRDPADASPPHYLLEDRPVSYLSSASLLAVLRSAEKARRAPRYSVVAFANPEYGSDVPTTPASGPDGASFARMQSSALASVIGPRDVFPPLPGTDTEAKAVVAALAPQPDSRPLYEGEAASRETLLQLQAADCAKAPCLRDYRYVLFATHAVLPDEVEGLLQPALVLAHPERGDGFVTMSDVLGLTLDADVVSLSACNTGGGTLTHGDGVRGLTQAFMFAGTPVVTVTLWQLSDAAAAESTPAFYAGLTAGKSPAAALRDAKLALLHGDDALLRYPFFWAPTVIFGDGPGAGVASQ
jgi:tetratricopeptide (TPR) repeat protein/CHAT domain-containing protein